MVAPAQEAAHEATDPARGAFLDVLSGDIRSHPERPKAFDRALYNQMKALVGEVEIELRATLSADDE